MLDILSPGSFSAFLQVIMIDLVLAGDNAVVIGMAAAGLPPALRRKAILIGIGAATILRILFAVIATKLLALTGLLLAGGLLLLWVCYKMWQELNSNDHHEAEHAMHAADAIVRPGARKTLRQAVMEFRPHAAHVVLAQRMGVDLEDRGLRLVAAVWMAINMTALADLGRDTGFKGVDIDDAVDRIDATFAQFAGMADGIAQLV